MDFFEHQETARKKTGRLVILFALAVLGIIAVTYFVIAGSMFYVSRESLLELSTSLWNWEVFVITAGGVLAVILLGSLYKTTILSAGGRVVAESLDGVLVDPGTRDPGERRLLNVVEEMAIAAGTTVPPVYLMEDEQAINAFAAGFSPDDAVIGVTRGSLERLSRDELQGVIAHEFSHILNGDMRLNIRLIGVVHGILVIGLIGWFMLRSMAYGRFGSSRRESGSLPFIVIGVTLMVVGFVGTFFGNLIKAAVSRQREFLADAAAVQFTRNPGGIGGALKKIMGVGRDSQMKNAHAVEVSHMLFSQGFSSFLQNLYATHPPLAERIRRIDRALVEERSAAATGRDAVPASARTAAPAAALSGLAAGVTKASPPEPRPVGASALSVIGRPEPAHLDRARELIQGVPGALLAAAHEPYGARAVVFLLLLDREPELQGKQLRRLAEGTDPAVHKETLALRPLLGRLDPAARLPLTEVAIASLRELSRTQYAAFKANVLALIRADDRVDVFEWVLHRLILHHLERPRVRAPKRTVRSLKSVANDCASLLSILARAGHEGEEAEAAFRKAAAPLGIGTPAPRVGGRWDPDTLDAALRKLARLAPRLKRSVLDACAVCIGADRKITVDEAELFRAIADSLDCPVPPILPGQPLADV